MTEFVFTGFLPDEEFKNDLVRLRILRSEAADPIRNWVPASYFTICRVSDDMPVGKCDFRIGYNTGTYWGGNIGYEIDAEYRGNGYAGAAAELLFMLAHRYGMPYVTVAVNTENRASQRVCEKLGGIRSDALDIPKEIDRYQRGERTTYLYRFDLPYHKI